MSKKVPIRFYITEAQIEWLRETEWCRKGQEMRIGRNGVNHLDGEWTIACDLAGIPRIFKDELRRVMNG